MTRARDLADLISSGSIESSEITSIDASKLSGTIADARIPNLAASKITSGTFADARIASSNVSQHATSFDDNKIVNDISTLAIRQASNENKIAYNSNSMSVDVFQDGSGIASNTNAPRNDSEYVSTLTPADGIDSNTVVLLSLNNNITDTSGNNITFTNFNTVTFDSSTKKFGSHSARFTQSNSEYLGTGDLSSGLTNAFPTTGDFTVDWWAAYVSRSASNRMFSIGNGANPASSTEPIITMAINHASNAGNVNLHGSAGVGGWNTDQSFSIASPWTSFRHYAYQRTSGTSYMWIDGTQLVNSSGATHLSGDSLMQNSNNLFLGVRSNTGTEFFDGYMDEFRISNNSRYTAGSNFTPHTTAYSAAINNATGNFISNAITAPTSTSKMGAIITYQNQAGTNTLNTDIVLQLSADNGSNFATATLTAMPDFATGIKMAKVNDLAVTAGTQLKYKISFANQAAGSKEARIRGVSLQY